MNWPRFALVTLFVLAAVGLALPWVIGIEVEAWPDSLRWALVGAILVAMFILGRDQRRKEQEEDTWVDDPRKSKFENWREKRRQRFNPKRGIEFFIVGLVVFSLIIAITAITGDVASLGGAVAFVLGMSVLAGLIGMFTEKVPL